MVTATLLSVFKQKKDTEFRITQYRTEICAIYHRK